MSETTQIPEPDESAVPAAADPDEPKGLRKQLSEAHKEIRQLKGEKFDGIITELGLEKDTGLGLVLTEQWDEGKIGLDEVASTAARYGHDPNNVSTHEQAEAISQGQASLDSLETDAGSIPVPTEATQIEQAESDGDYQKSLGMKADTVAGWFGKKP